MVFNIVLYHFFIIIKLAEHKRYFIFFYISTMETRREIEISTGLQIQKPPQLRTNGTFYAIYSPMKFKLRTCESIMLNLQLKIKLPDGVQGIIGLLPSLILQSLTIENSKRITLQTKDKLIKLDLLNRNFSNTISIKKNQEIVGLILLHSSHKSFVTRYKFLQ